MPTITLKKNKQTLTVSSGTNLMKALLQAKIPVGSSCHGQGICGKCKMSIVPKSTQALNSLTQSESELIQRGILPLDQRLSCQVVVNSDIEVDTPYW